MPLTILPGRQSALPWEAGALQSPQPGQAPAPAPLGDQLGAQASNVGRMWTAPNPEPAPGKPQHFNPFREVQSFVGKVTATVMLPLDMLNQGVASLTYNIAMMLPAFPAVRLFQDFCLTLHVHPHPPTFGVPIPALGPCIVAGACSVLINGLPAARTGDLGLSAWCGGYFPLFEVMTGSSHCMIQGARPARMTDFTLHCSPPMSLSRFGKALMIFNAAVGVVGLAAAATDFGFAVADDAMAEAAAASTEATVAGIQLAADAAAMALSLMAGKDPAVPPAIGTFIMGSPNVIIGGFPMPGWQLILKGLLKILRLIARAIQLLLPKNSRLRNALCKFTGHPVDVASGRVFTSRLDFALEGLLPVRLERAYDSAACDYDGPFGPGWTHPYDIHLWLDDVQEMIVLRDEEANVIGFAPVAVGARTYNPLHKMWLERFGEAGYRILRSGLSYTFMGFAEPGEGRSESGALRLVSIEDAHGNRISLTHEDGRLVSLEDPARRRLQFGWARVRNGTVRLSSATLDAGAGEAPTLLVSYDYDESGRLVAATDRTRQPFTYAYDGDLLVRETDRTGLSFHFEYDAVRQRCIHTWGDGGIHDHKLAYGDGITVVEDSTGAKYSYEWNESGLVTKITDPYGTANTWEYDDALRLVADTDPLGYSIRYEYDLFSNLARTQDSAGSSMQVQYDARNNPVHAVDPNGGEWTWVYDSSGQLIERVNPVGEHKQYQYEEGLLRKMIGPAGAAAEFEYDDRKFLVRLRIPDGKEIDYHYDQFGRIIERRDSRGAVQRRSYDATGELSTIEEPDGNVRAFTYNAEADLIEYRDRVRHVRFAYSGFHRLAARSEADGTVRFVHDTEGRLTEVLNEHSESYALVRDANGRIREEHDFAGRIWRYSLDAGGRPIAIQKPSGATVRMEYDPAGRLAGVLYPDGTAEKYEYRPDGNMTAAVNDAAEVRFELDGIGRVVREAQGQDWVASTYNLPGDRVASETSLGLRQQMDWNPLGDMTAMAVEAEGGKWQIDFRRDVWGSEVERRLPGGVIARWGRDHISRPQVVSVSRRGFELSRWGYGWGFDERLTSLIDARGGATELQHDPRGRLVAATSPDGSIEYRSMDAAGNIYRRPDRGDLRYGKGGVLLEADGVRFRYDADGNLAERVHPDGATWRFEYDGAGRLQRVVRPDGSRVAFEYDAFGRRISKRSGFEKFRWIWDGRNVVHEIAGEADVTTWVYEPDSFSPIAKINGRFYSVIPDQLGSPAELYDEGGEAAWKGRLDLLGNARIELASTACPWRWPGQYEDPETGLCYNGLRYYDPGTGGFITPDPIGLLGGLHPFAYVADPFRQIDPLGLDWNYRLRDSEGRVYYVGRASDNETPADVMRRHSRTQGGTPEDPHFRFVPGEDRFEIITPRGTSKNIVRGIEQLGVQDHGTAIGRRSANGNNVRGNNIKGVDPTNPRKRIYMGQGRAFLNRLNADKASDLQELTEDEWKQGIRKEC